MINQNSKNRLKIALIILLMSISIGALSYSFGWVSTNPHNVTSNYFLISDIDFGLTSDVDSVSLGEVLPTLDKFGILNEAFTFTVQNTSDDSQDYIVKLIDGEKISTIPNKEIRYQLTIDDEVIGVYNLTNSGIIDSGILDVNEKHKYSLKIWLDYNSDQTNGVWDKIVLVDAGDNNLDTSGANKPSLSSGMIPVYYDEDNEVWRKADSNNSEKNYQWYDYDSLMWANVATVSDNTRNYYISSKLGTEINMKDINSMWVWIPRYKYAIFNNDSTSDSPVKIDVKFESGVKSTGTVTCKKQFDSKIGLSEICGDTKNGSIKNGISTYTHPAFTFGDKEVEGIWVSKFEAGTNDDSSCSLNASIKNCDNDTLEIYIKPSIKSVGNIKMVNLAINFKKMSLNGNIYGFDGGEVLNSDLTIDDDENSIDIHMIKNSEWGAVAYLYHSKYGKYFNNNYGNNNKEIYYNASLTTGSSTGSINTQNENYQYKVNELGTGASTTGNVYGVYDMNGGKMEMVMVNLQNDYNVFVSNENSGFKEKINSRYYDIYFNDDDINITNFGDGLKETPWYNDTQKILTNKVLCRYNVFGINTMNGDTAMNVGSRPVLIAESNVYISKW